MVNCQEIQLVFFSSERSRYACRSGAYNNQIIRGIMGFLQRFYNMFHCLAALFHGVPDKAHAAKFPGNEYSRDVGLEIFVYVG